MKVNQVVNAWAFKQPGNGQESQCIGRRVLLQSTVKGSGAVTALVKVQGSNTPALEQSWIDIGLQARPSGTDTSTAFAEAQCFFAYVRQVAVSLTGDLVTSTISAK